MGSLYDNLREEVFYIKKSRILYFYVYLIMTMIKVSDGQFTFWVISTKAMNWMQFMVT